MFMFVLLLKYIIKGMGHKTNTLLYLGLYTVYIIVYCI